MDFAELPGNQAQQHVGNEPEGDSVGNTKCKWNQHDSQESRKIFLRIFPGDPATLRIMKDPTTIRAGATVG